MLMDLDHCFRLLSWVHFPLTCKVFCAISIITNKLRSPAGLLTCDSSCPIAIVYPALGPPRYHMLVSSCCFPDPWRDMTLRDWDVRATSLISVSSRHSTSYTFPPVPTKWCLNYLSRWAPYATFLNGYSLARVLKEVVEQRVKFWKCHRRI